jgi:hypothetical protein
MSDKRKATCPVPSAVIAACQTRLAELQARSKAAGYAQLVAEGVTVLARTSETAPKRIDLCRSKYPDFDRMIATHIPAAAREQARQLKRARGFRSFQEVYLEAVLATLVDRGLLTPALDPKAGDGEPVGRESARRRAA